jgi:hypothetical protein
MKPDLPLVSAEELLELASRAAAARVRLRAAARTAVSRDVLIRLRSAYRTHDRMGTQPWQPGDSVRLLILRDLLTRGQYNVRTFHAVAEIRVRVVLDCSRSLLDHPQTGPFAVKFALALAGAGAWRKQATSLTFLDPTGRLSTTRPITRFAQLGALVGPLCSVSPVSMRPGEAAALLEQHLGTPQANVNLFLLMHAGYPLADLDFVLRTLRRHAVQALVLPIVAAEELEDVPGPIHDPETGARVQAPADRIVRLADHLDAMRRAGDRAGVGVEPLVVADHRADLDALLPLLAGL